MPQNEARLKAVLDSLSEGVAAVGTGGQLLFANDAMARLLGFASAAELPSMRIEEALSRVEAFAEDGSRLSFAERPLVRALNGETVLDVPLRLRQPLQGREYEVVNSAIPVTDAAGRVMMAVIRMRDVTAQRQAMRALKESEDRYQLATRAVDAMVYDWNVSTGHVQRSDALEGLLGFRSDEAEPTVEWWRSRIHPQDVSPAGSQVEEQLARGLERQVAEYRIRHRDGRWISVADRGLAIYGPGGQPVRVVGSTVDVTERKHAEERQQLLVRELQHRTKNMLAVVQSIAGNTLRRAGSLEGAQHALVGRLHALARAQEFVASGSGGGVPLSDLVEAELAPFAGRAQVRGRPLVVGTTFAQNFSLVLHELATNAAKHGSLSTPDGSVAVAWSVAGPPGEETLTFAWTEAGGPPAMPPRTPGFGTQVISVVGQPQVTFGTQGLRYTVTVALAEATR